MEYKNGTPALHWFNYLGLAAANDMSWNAAEGQPIPKYEAELKKIATMEFDWLDCPDLNQAEDITHPTMGTEDLSVITFDKGHKPSGKATADDDSLATAQALVNTVKKQAMCQVRIIASLNLAPEIKLERLDLINFGC